MLFIISFFQAADIKYDVAERRIIKTNNNLNLNTVFMRKRTLALVSLLTGFFCFSQTEFYFKYDEVGDQRYRGPDAAARLSSQTNSQDSNKSASPQQTQAMDEKTFWNQLRLYPAPVNDYFIAY